MTYIEADLVLVAIVALIALGSIATGLVLWRREHAASKRFRERWAANAATLSTEMYFWRKTVEVLIRPAGQGSETVCPFCGRHDRAAIWTIYHIREAHPAGTPPRSTQTEDLARALPSFMLPKPVPMTPMSSAFEHPMTLRESDADHGLPPAGAGLDVAASMRQHAADIFDAGSSLR